MSSAASGLFAVIDLGVNAIHLEIMQYDGEGGVEFVESLLNSVTLGRDIFSTGKISNENMRVAASICKEYARVIAEYQVENNRVFVTGAIREAENLDILISRIKMASGFDVETLEPMEEVKLNFIAVTESLRHHHSLDSQHVAICRIGRSNTEYYFLKNSLLTHSHSLRFGTMRLLEEVGNEFTRRKILDEASSYVSGLVEGVPSLAGQQLDLLIAMGGNVRLICQLIFSTEPTAKAVTLTRDQLSGFYEDIAGKSAGELAVRFGISDDEAATLEPCAIMLKEFFISAGTDFLLIPLGNIREAMGIDHFRSLAKLPDPFDGQILSAASYLGRKFNYNKAHSTTVANYAVTLFDQLVEVHGLGQRQRLLLEIASLLHDCGLFISTRAHHKHSFYLIKNSSLPGLSREEQNLVALIARYHRKALPSASHQDYSSLDFKERIMVCKLAAILRIADALDRSYNGGPEIERVESDEEKIKIVVNTSGDIELEKRSVKKKSDLFVETFGLKVRLEMI